ncbi:glycerophosphodiester phosphodiesterase [bacterium]|nr:glycerophosphodiester phosphodiesterase [bacterium]
MPIRPEVLNKLAVHGHRGSRGTHPENTFPAFEEAVASGAQVLELDLQFTADNVPVVTHDPEITNRLCTYHDGREVTQPIPIRSLKLEELGQFDCGGVPQARFPQQKKIPGTRIPTLDAFLNWWKTKAAHLELNIETKMTAADPKWIPDPELFTRTILEVFRKHGAVEKTILQSFDFRTLRIAKKLEPKLRLSCLFENERNFCELTAAEGAQWASPYLGLVNAHEVGKCHGLGIQVVPWTANNPAEWRPLLESGVDAIISDYPRELLGFLKQLKNEHT